MLLSEEMRLGMAFATRVTGGAPIDVAVWGEMRVGMAFATRVTGAAPVDRPCRNFSGEGNLPRKGACHDGARVSA
jgi:hypothetical protein